MISHQYDLDLIYFWLRDIEHLVRGILAEGEHLILVDIIKVQDLTKAFNLLQEAVASHYVLLVLSVVNTNDLLVVSVVQSVHARQLSDKLDVLELC